MYMIKKIHSILRILHVVRLTICTCTQAILFHSKKKKKKKLTWIICPGRKWFSSVAQVSERGAIERAGFRTRERIGIRPRLWTQRGRSCDWSRRSRGSGLHPASGHDQYVEQHFIEEGRRSETLEVTLLMLPPLMILFLHAFLLLIPSFRLVRRGISPLSFATLEYFKQENWNWKEEAKKIVKYFRNREREERLLNFIAYKFQCRWKRTINANENPFTILWYSYEIYRPDSFFFFFYITNFNLFDFVKYSSKLSLKIIFRYYNT